MNTQHSNTTRNTAYRTRALPAAILLGLLMSAPAFAATGQAAPADPGSAPQQDAGSGAQGNGGQQKKTPQTLGTITVTSSGRVQQVVAVPYNVSVVTGDTIERDHVLDNAELFRSIPGVNVVDSGPRNSGVVNNIRIRGINVDSSALGDYAVTSVAPVATYIDTVPLFANFLLFDINRVEVLRGPQGTLYGSGSLGGTVRYILNKPLLNQFGGSVSASLSNTDGSSGIGNSESLVLNAPLGNTLALRVDGARNDFPGVTDYVNLYQLDGNGIPVAPGGILSPDAAYHSKKDADTVKQDYGRASLLWKPNDSFDVQLSYMAQADRFGARRGTSLGTDGYGVPYQRNQLGAVQLEPSDRHVNLTSLEASLDVGFATLTSSTSYYNHKGDIVSDNTGFYAKQGWYSSLYYNYPRPMSTAFRTYGDKAFTQELRLVSKTGGAFDYIVGAYFRNQHSYTSQLSELRGFKNWWDAAYPAFASAVDPSSDDYSYLASSHYRETALYGQGTWHATDRLDLTVGVRAFRDKFTASVDSALPLWVGLFPPGHAENEQKNDKTLYYANLSWWLNDKNQFYATASQGYRRGGANGTPTSGFFAESPAWLFYRPDTVDNYEAGFKGIVGGMTYTADVFYTNWKDPQLNTATTNWGFFAVQNMGRAKSRGVELELQGRLGDHFSYGVGYTYTDATLAEDAYTPTGGLINTSGAALPGVSRNHLNAFGDYSFGAAGGLFTLHLDGSYQSSSQNSISLSPLYKYTLPGFTLWNASASYSRDAWTATLWLKNLTNTEGATGVYTTEYMGTAPSEGFYGNGSKLLTALPRTVGVTFTYRF